MSTLTVADVSLEAGGPAWLRAAWRPPRLCLHWWGVHRTLSNQQKEEVGRRLRRRHAFPHRRQEDHRCASRGVPQTHVHSHAHHLLLAGPDVTLHRAGRALDPPVRTWRRSSTLLQGFKEELTPGRAVELDAVYHQIQHDALRRLGRLFNPADYPPELRGLFLVEWGFPVGGTSQLFTAAQPGSLPGRAGAAHAPLRAGG